MIQSSTELFFGGRSRLVLPINDSVIRRQNYFLVVDHWSRQRSFPVRLLLSWVLPAYRFSHKYYITVEGFYGGGLPSRSHGGLRYHFVGFTFRVFPLVSHRRMSWSLSFIFSNELVEVLLRQAAGFLWGVFPACRFPPL